MSLDISVILDQHADLSRVEFHSHHLVLILVRGANAAEDYEEVVLHWLDDVGGP